MTAAKKGSRPGGPGDPGVAAAPWGVENSTAYVLQLQAAWRALSEAPATGAHSVARDVALLALLCATVSRLCAAVPGEQHASGRLGSPDAGEDARGGAARHYALRSDARRRLAVRCSARAAVCTRGRGLGVPRARAARAAPPGRERHVSVSAWEVPAGDAGRSWRRRPALVKGFMQLYSVDQKRSQALEAHAAAFATLKARRCPAGPARAPAAPSSLDGRMARRGAEARCKRRRRAGRTWRHGHCAALRTGGLLRRPASEPRCHADGARACCLCAVHGVASSWLLAPALIWRGGRARAPQPAGRPSRATAAWARCKRGVRQGLATPQSLRAQLPWQGCAGMPGATECPNLPKPRQAAGAEGGSTVISFAQKTFSGGALTSKLHVIELGAQPGAPPGRCAARALPDTPRPSGAEARHHWCVKSSRWSPFRVLSQSPGLPPGLIVCGHHVRRPRAEPPR